MYAIVDIETTGGKFNEEGITEIAIYKFDGHQIVDQFISLVNPEKEIQPFVVQLTGINNKMLRNAPKFHEVAKRIVEIMDGCILVAHNTSFDYRILRTEFRRLGYEFIQKTLCTVALSKKLLPEQEKYKLSTLVRALGIPISNVHRASGDALATVELFKVLLAKDVEKTIVSQTIKSGVEKKINEKFTTILNNIPSETGVFYIHNNQGEIIFIGKSRNIKKSVNKIFTHKSKKNKNIQKEVHTVTFELTGNELISILKEKQEINKNSPIYNATRRHKSFQFAFYQKKNEDGYISVHYAKIDGRKKAITTFVNEQEAYDFNKRITKHYQLCQFVNQINGTTQPCNAYKHHQCKGACNQKEEDSKIYNKRVQQFIADYQYKSTNKIIIDKGRTPQESSVILLENGSYKGFGFVKLNHQIQNIEILRGLITPMDDSIEIQQTIQSYLRRKRVKKTLNLPINS